MASKYHSKKEIVDGVKFASKREAQRYRDLRLLERAGAIHGLELQPKFALKVNGKLVCNYIADFAYFTGTSRVYEDSKGFKTPAYRIKKKLLMALNPGLDHREV